MAGLDPGDLDRDADRKRDEPEAAYITEAAGTDTGANPNKRYRYDQQVEVPAEVLEAICREWRGLPVGTSRSKDQIDWAVHPGDGADQDPDHPSRHGCDTTSDGDLTGADRVGASQSSRPCQQQCARCEQQ